MNEKRRVEENEDIESACELIGKHYKNYIVLAHRNVDGTACMRSVSAGDPVVIRGLVAQCTNNMDSKRCKED